MYKENLKTLNTSLKLTRKMEGEKFVYPATKKNPRLQYTAQKAGPKRIEEKILVYPATKKAHQFPVPNSRHLAQEHNDGREEEKESCKRT